MRRKIIAVLVAVVAFGLIAASAASLGGIRADNVGADSVVTAACDSDGVSVDWRTRWEQNGPFYELRQVRVDDIADACLGQRISIAIVDSFGNTLGRRGPSAIRVGPPPWGGAPDDPTGDNWRRWGIANRNIDVSQDFTIHVSIAP